MSKTLSFAIVFAVLTLVFSKFISDPPIQTTPFPIPETVLISHGGGGIQAGPRTNSLQALEASVDRGFKYIEIDLVRLDDGELVLLYGWNKVYERYFLAGTGLFAGLSSELPKKVFNTSDFKALKMRRGLTQMTFDELLDWMNDHPNVSIITDFKQVDYLDSLESLSQRAGVRRDRFIPQIYDLDDYDRMQAAGFKDIIFSVYKQKNVPMDVLLANSKNYELFAVTVPKARVLETDANLIKNSPFRVFTHTVNDLDLSMRLVQAGVTGVYTDYLYPKPIQKRP